MKPIINPRLLEKVGVSNPLDSIQKAVEESRPLDIVELAHLDPLKAVTVVEQSLEANNLQEDLELETQLKALHKLLLVNATEKQIAEQLKVTPKRVKELKAALKQKLKTEMLATDRAGLIAESAKFYDYIRAMALQEWAALNEKEKRGTKSYARDKNSMLLAALQAEGQKNNFLLNTGILDELRGIQEKEKHIEAAALTQKLLSSIMSDDVIDVSFEEIIDIKEPELEDADQ